jgi:hypothetical protein
MGAVWNDPANADLRQQRGDPHVLAPLDILKIPETEPIWHSLTTGTTNEFTASTPPLLHGRVQCFGLDGQPIAGATFTVLDVSPPTQGTTTDDGTAEFSFPSDVSTVRLEFADLKLVLLAHVAHLDPITTPSGVQQRLEGLRIIPPLPIIPDEDFRDMLAEYAVIAGLQRFQRQQGIEPTGELDDATLQALVKAYGA